MQSLAKICSPNYDACGISLQACGLGFAGGAILLLIAIGCAHTQAGLDSLGAVDLCNAVGIRFGIDLPATAAFDYPTAAALADLVSAGTAPTQAWHKPLAVMPTGVKAVYDITY